MNSCYNKQRTVLLTGGTSKIGEAIAENLAQNGNNIILLGRAADALKILKEQLSTRYDIKVTLCIANLIYPEEVRETLETLDSHANILIHNAGRYASGTLEDLNPATIQEDVAIQISSLIVIIQQFLQYMRDQDFGRIIIISSAAAFLGSRSPSYAISKSAIQGLNRSIIRNIGKDNITCNAVVPGPIENTSMFKALPSKRKKELLQDIPMGRFGSPEDVAHLVEFLVSEKASYITGQCLHLNGGMVTS